MKEIKKYCLNTVIKGVSIFYLALIFAGIFWIFSVATYDRNWLSDLSTRLLMTFLLLVSDYLLYYFGYARKAKMLKKRIQFFKTQGVANYLEQDFAQGVRMFGGQLVVGKRFMFGKRSGMIVAYQEISYIFRHEHTIEYESGRTPTKKYTLKFNAGNKQYVLCTIPNQFIVSQEWYQFCNFINLKNPNIAITQNFEKSRSHVDDTASDD